MKKIILIFLSFSKIIFSAQENNQSLIQAIHTQDLHQIQEFIITKINQNKFNDIILGFHDIATAIIFYNVDFNQPNVWDEIVKLFLSAGISLEQLDSVGLTPLMRAAINHELKAIYLFLIHGAKISDVYPQDEIYYDYGGEPAWSTNYYQARENINTVYNQIKRKIIFDNIPSLPNELVDIINEY